MANLNFIELKSGLKIPLLYEDRSVLAIDKPSGWMLAPGEWQETGRNLFAALTSSLRAGDFWARSRNLKYLRHVHRLDADTSGVLLLAKSPGALAAYSRMFESRSVEKLYLAIVRGVPRELRWICRLELAPDPRRIGTMKVDARKGKKAETHFRLLQSCRDAAGESISLVLAKPITGRTHQIRLHLAESGHPILGDPLYSRSKSAPPNLDGSSNILDKTEPASPEAEVRGQRSRFKSHVTGFPLDQPLALRAVCLSYVDPFTQRRVEIAAPFQEFMRKYGFSDARLFLRLTAARSISAARATLR